MCVSLSTEPPDSVSISLTGHAGPMLEARPYTLLCDVKDVAPVENLRVTFHRGQTTLARLIPTTKPQLEPVSEVFTLSIDVSREDDGAQYWCKAELDLGRDGPQPPPVVMSQNFITTVHCESDNSVSTAPTV